MRREGDQSRGVTEPSWGGFRNIINVVWHDLRAERTFVSTQFIIFFLIGLLVGGSIAAVITSLVVRSKCSQADADLVRQRDSAQQALKERDATRGDLMEALKEATQKVAVQAERIIALEKEKSRFEGEATALVTLRSEVLARDKKLEAVGERIIALEATKADLEQKVKATEAAKFQALEANDRFVMERLNGMDASNQAQLAEKDKALEAVLREKDRAIQQQKTLLAETERIMTEKFSALSLDSLKSASEDFLRLASERFDKAGEVSKAELEKRQQAIDELLKPVAETLDKLGQQHQAMEERRVSAFDAIEKGIKTLSSEADQLANALRKPTSRGAWGEMNLQVILENAGLVQGEHFVLQDTTSDDEAGRARTDVLVRLPQGRHLIIDSKTPLEACWEGLNATDEAVRRERFAAHARLVREHIKQLSSKGYWTRYEASPDFTIMFVPTEGAYQAALEADGTLIAEAQKSRIYITSPMTLMTMIHAIAFVLREERLAQNAQQVQETAAELYRRLAKFIEHVEKLGRNLRLTVENFNSAVGSLDGRVLPVARKMNGFGIGGGADITDVSEVETAPRSVVSSDHLLLPKNAVLDFAAGDQ